MPKSHVFKRAMPLGRWGPLTFYAANVILWLITALQAHAYVLLWLTILPLPALGLYCWRTHRSLT